MLAIGFANTFYTLWSIETRDNYTTDSRGNHHLSSRTKIFTYYQNVSKDLAKVKARYPDLEIMEDLRGKTSSWEYDSASKGEDLCPQIMKFGKYKGEDLNELLEKDFNYVLWLVEQGSYSSNRIFAEGLSEIKAHIQAKKEQEEFLLSSREQSFNKIIEAGVLTFNPIRNLGVGERFASIIVEVEGINISLVFRSSLFTSNYYNGFTYGLPIVKGKAKRMKFKTVTVSLDIEATEAAWTDGTLERWDKSIFVKETIEVK